MIVAIAGSRSFTDESKVRMVLEKYVERYGKENLIVVSGGADGADYLGKKVALQLGLKYEEFPPSHFKHNIYCVRPADEYNKPYHVSNFFSRNTQMAEYCEHLVAFTVKGKPCRGTWDTVRKVQQLKKPYVVIEE